MSASERLIRASEVGTYAYCARAWWLQVIQEVPSRNVQAMQTGTRRHERHGDFVFRARRWRAVAYLLLTLALSLFILGIWLHG